MPDTAERRPGETGAALTPDLYEHPKDTALDLAGVLERLGYAGDERVQIATARGGAFAARVHHHAALPAVALDRDTWFGVNPCVDVAKGRPASNDVTRLAAVPTDLDDKAGGCGDRATAHAIVGDLVEILRIEPAVEILSGHGVQPLWAVEGGEITAKFSRGDARVLLRRFGRLVHHVAELRNAEVDSVFDLPRILRCPGSVNHKDATAPVGVETAGAVAWQPISVERLAEVLDEYGVAELDGDRDDPGAIVSSPADWRYRDRDCPYVAAMVAGALADEVTERHKWLVQHLVRVACLHRHGCLSAKGHQGAVNSLVGRFRTLRSPGRGEIADAIGWSVAKAAGKSAEQLQTEIGLPHKHDVKPEAPQQERSNMPPPPPVTLDQCHAVFTRWLGDQYDLESLDAVLAAAAVEQLDGDPVWLLVVSGSGNAKTETVQPLEGAGALIVSTIASQGALLSGTAARDRAKNATGGLLRELGDRGLLVIKDVTSILSMGREMRGEVLGALREVYDGHWIRRMGVDGGRSIPWRGRLVVIGAVTTAWDRAHAVVATMGDRFVLVRMDSNTGRQSAGRKAIANTGSEVEMRADLAAAAGGVLAGVDAAAAITLTEAEAELLLSAADIVTRARTGVEYDYRGDVIDSHAPEMPTRFAKQLAQVVRGGVAVGMTRADALRLAIRCARDSMPPMRLAILLDVANHPHASLSEVRARIGKPRTTVDRQLQSLNMLDVLDVDEVVEEVQSGRYGGTVWRYTVADGIDPGSLDPNTAPDLLGGAYASKKEPPGTARTTDPYTGGPTNLVRSAAGRHHCAVAGCGQLLLLLDGRTICARTDAEHIAARAGAA